MAATVLAPSKPDEVTSTCAADEEAALIGGAADAPVIEFAVEAVGTSAAGNVAVLAHTLGFAPGVLEQGTGAVKAAAKRRGRGRYTVILCLVCG